MNGASSINTTYDRVEMIIDQLRKVDAETTRYSYTSCNLPRGTGKTMYIMNNARLKDFIIVKSPELVRHIKEGFAINSDRILAFDQLKTMPGMGVPPEFTVYGDELDERTRKYVTSYFRTSFPKSVISLVFLQTE